MSFPSIVLELETFQVSSEWLILNILLINFQLIQQKWLSNTDITLAKQLRILSSDKTSRILKNDCFIIKSGSLNPVERVRSVQIR